MAGDMAQWLRMCTTLWEDLSSVPSTHLAAHTVYFDEIQFHPGLCGTRQANGIHVCMHVCVQNT